MLVSLDLLLIAPKLVPKESELTMSSRTSPGSEFLVLTAPNSEFHPPCSRTRHQLARPLTKQDSRHEELTAISGALSSVWSSGVSPRVPRRTRIASAISDVPWGGAT